MMKIYLLLCIALWSPAVLSSDVVRRWADRPVDYPGNHDTGQDLHDALADDIDQTYTDFGQGLTSIKDSRRNACFLFDLDPNIELHDEDKDSILTSQEPKSVETDKEFHAFVHRVGPNIANMCRTSKVFWLTEEPTNIDFDVPSKPDTPISRLIQPPKVRQAAIPRSRMNIPHLARSRPEEHQPRPAHAHRNNAAPAPPPVNEYRARHRNHPPSLRALDHPQAPRAPDHHPAPRAPDHPPAPRTPNNPPAPRAPDHPPAPRAPNNPPAPRAPNHPPAPRAPNHAPAPRAPAHPPAPRAPDHPPAPRAPNHPPAPRTPNHPPAPRAPARNRNLHPAKPPASRDGPETLEPIIQLSYKIPPPLHGH